MPESTDGYSASGSADGSAFGIAQLRVIEEMQFHAYKEANAEHDEAQSAEHLFQEWSRLQNERCRQQKERLHSAKQELDRIPHTTKWQKMNGRVQKQGDIALIDARKAKNLQARIRLLTGDVKFSEKRFKILSGRHKQALTKLGNAVLKRQDTFLSWVQAQKARLAAQTAADELADEQADMDAAEMATAAAAFVQGAECAAGQVVARGSSAGNARPGGRAPRAILPSASKHVEHALRYSSF